ncbi:MAG: hypothetical protein U9O63_08560 [Actinomycetota bacterium]|nr:hypothetical protein [Actinomycetota bacterium]
MHRRLAILATVTVLIGLVAAPAAADNPSAFGPFTFPIDGVDPCTGSPHQITLEFVVFAHEGHKNNFVERLEMSGSTDSGYVLVGGHNNFVANNNVVTSGFKEVWSNPETGAKYQATGKFKITGNGAVVDEFALRCVGAATILP